MDQLDDKGDIKGNEKTGKAQSPVGLSTLLPSFIRPPNPSPHQVPSEPNNASIANGMLNSIRSLAWIRGQKYGLATCVESLKRRPWVWVGRVGDGAGVARWGISTSRSNSVENAEDMCAGSDRMRK